MSYQEPPPGAVLVVVPATETMYVQTVQAIHRLDLPAGSDVQFYRGGSTLTHKRNTIVQDFLRHTGFEWLLLLDSDMTPPPDAVRRLLAANKPVVGALCFARLPPYLACAGTRDETGAFTSLTTVGGPDPVQEVAYVGTGCLLVHRDALAAMPAPHFADWEGTPGAGEDVTFCLNAAKAGFPVHCDTGLCVGHLGVVAVDLDFVRAWQETPAARRHLAALDK